jgi:hypothetical protein
MSEMAFQGVSFASVRALLTMLYFYHDGMTEAEWNECLKYVVPMQHNWETPIEPGAQDTWIQYWIDADDRLTQDYTEGGVNGVQKIADITIRFLGRRAEAWAKAFHHMTARLSVADLFNNICNGNFLEYVGPIIPSNVDYFGTGNTTIAFTLGIRLQYVELLDLSDNIGPLEYTSFPAGLIATGG